VYAWALFLQSPEINFSRSQRMLGDARAAEPDSPWPYVVMARIRAHSGALEGAHELLLKARALAPKDGEVVEEVEMFEARLAEEEGRERAPESGDDAEDSGLGARIKSLFKRR
jgi:hypothetical protein